MISVLSLLCVSLLSAASPANLHDLDWTHGEWAGDSSYGHFEMIFSSVKGDRLMVMSRLTDAKKDEVTFFEFAQIRQEGAHLVLYPIPFGRPLESYTAVESAGPVYTFVNPMRSYPRMLSYEYLSAESMKFIIEGTQGDVVTRNEFLLVKVK